MRADGKTFRSSFTALLQGWLDSAAPKGSPGGRLVWLLFRSDPVWLEVCVAFVSLVEAMRFQIATYPLREAADYFSHGHGWVLGYAHGLLAFMVLHGVIYGGSCLRKWHATKLSALAMVWTVQTAFAYDSMSIALATLPDFCANVVVAALVGFAALRAVGHANVAAR